MMDKAIDKARESMDKNYGGPFGAAIMYKGKIIAVSSNTVLRDNDPTAHAEINAIREASKVLKTYDLSGCVLYATGYPCPMCLSAIIWANIKEVYYGAEVAIAEKIGFKDNFIYKFIQSDNNDEVLKIAQLDRNKCVEMMEEYHKNSKTIY